MTGKHMSVSIYREGGKSKAICQHCERIVDTTFLYRDAQFSDGKGSAKNILVAVCDTCGEVVAIPAQSTAAIHKARQRSENRKTGSA